ncbi:MAG TPA: GNAT family protein [Acidobacteriota bacterium]|nr:GNAT family protein [Acidobacteriota bacterium]
MKVEPVTLTGKVVKLVPLEIGHVPALCSIGLDPEIWKWTVANITNESDMRAYVETALDEQRRGLSLPFVTMHLPTNSIVGSTRFGNIDTANKRVEIGWTWIARPYQRTSVNTEAKFLMLQHAFETLSCIRVEFKTDSFNEKSRNALLRIGATQEGIFRNHMIVATGRIRHSVYFSIIDSEWPAVKQDLLQKLSTT